LVLVLVIITATLYVALDRASTTAAKQASPGGPFIEFESGQVRPVALSPNGARLFAVNTPDNTLEIFGVTPAGLALQARVPVGLEPVAVAARDDSEVWVVNHLSDSVSVVALDGGTPRVVATLLVGDEPRDIVFAGSPSRAFITTAHRGQHRTDASIAGVPGAGDPQLTTPGVGRADVWVFNPAALGTATGGNPVKIMTFFTDTPRALAVSPDKATVYVAGFHSGNQTTTIFEQLICNNFDVNTPCTINGATMPGGQLGPSTNFEGKQAPRVGMILKFNNDAQQWQDELGRNWNNAVRFRLPDRDVFAVNANTLAQTAVFAHVGTTLFNMITNPVSGKVYVSNTEAFNNVRFEGPGIFGGSTVQGHLAETRVTVLSGSTVTPRHLNKHIDYTKLMGEPGFDPTAKNHSLSTPLDMAVTGDGRTLFLAAFGSSKIGVFDTTALENDTFDPRTASANYITVSGGGPSGLALDEPRGRLYVMTRFDNSVKVIDLATKREIAQATLPNPEPASVVQGRPLLYDATRFSGNGEASCASCHIFGDMDDLAWDLGNPDDAVKKNPMNIIFGSSTSIALGSLLFGVNTPINGTGAPDDFHPMKGPMTTQTLRGLLNSGAMHWRGDRSNGAFGINATDANLSFNNFIVAFEGLIGGTLPSAAQMQQFTDFQLQVIPPPNPVRRLDNSLTAAQQRGSNFYFGDRSADGISIPLIGGETHNCNGCHVVDRAQGFFGTGRSASFEGITQIVKIPHLRNMYAKVGMFGGAKVPFFLAPDSGNMGDQIRGFGFVNDGSVDTMFRFVSAIVFRPLLNTGFPLINPDRTRRDVEQFLLAFDTDLAPIVGQQVTLNTANAKTVNPRIDLMIKRAETPFVSKELGGVVKECDLVAQVALRGRIQSFLYDPVARNFIPDDGGPRLSDAALRALAAMPGQEVTYTCATPGAGQRLAFYQ